MSVLELIVCKTRVCHIPLASQHIHRHNNERCENGDGRMSEVYRGG